MKVFDVQISNPREAAPSYTENIPLFVIADNAQTAISLVLAQYPKASIWQVICRGGYSKSRVIIDLELLRAC